jgi:hypothetical protein
LSNIKTRTDFIVAVQQLGRHFDDLAREKAVRATRTNNKDDMQEARDMVIKADAYHEVTDKVIDLIHAHWPK